jgi:hypothetical protein
VADARDLRKLLNTKQDVIDFKGTPSIGGMTEGQIALSQSSGGQLAIHRKKYGKLWKSYMSYNGDQYVDRNLSISGGLVIGGTRTERTQPAFLAFNGSSDTGGLTVDDWTTVDFSTEVFDVGGNFASDTFTAPVKGLYFLTTQVTLSQLDTDSTGYRVALITTNRTYTAYLDTDQYLDADTSWHVITPITSVCDMNAGDTAYVAVFQTGGASITDVIGHSTAVLTYFSGYLLG